MKQRARQIGVAAVVSLSLASLMWQSCQCAAWSFDRTHKMLTAELKKYTDNNGVHYKRWQKHSANLERYLNSLETITADQYDQMSAPDRAALWLNVYCALTIKIILDHYPIDGKKLYYPSNSIRQIPNCWEADFVSVAGRKINLWQIYHDVIRKDIKDIRTHFGIFCGANGCSTQRAAYTGAKLDNQLNQSMHKYLADKRNVDLDLANKKIFVSQVFKWFPLDFAPEAGFQKIPFPPPTDDEIVLGYLSMHGPDDVQQALAGVRNRSEYKVVYREFDWSLNDTDSPPVKAVDPSSAPKSAEDNADAPGKSSEGKTDTAPAKTSTLNANTAPAKTYTDNADTAPAKTSTDNADAAPAKTSTDNADTAPAK